MIAVFSFVFHTIGCLAQTRHHGLMGQEDSLKMFLRTYVGDPKVGDNSLTRYFAAFVDLRDDGTKDAIVYLTDDGWCGTSGCRTLILAPEGSSYRVVKTITVAQLPIRVLGTKSNGWHDIVFRVQGGGVEHAYEAKLSFNGKTYHSISPARRLTTKAQGEIVVPSDAEGKLLYQ